MAVVYAGKLLKAWTDALAHSAASGECEKRKGGNKR